jgi:hypothetical protein
MLFYKNIQNVSSFILPMHRMPELAGGMCVNYIIILHKETAGCTNDGTRFW